MIAASCQTTVLVIPIKFLQYILLSVNTLVFRPGVGSTQIQSAIRSNSPNFFISCLSAYQNVILIDYNTK